MTWSDLSSTLGSMLGFGCRMPVEYIGAFGGIAVARTCWLVYGLLLSCFAGCGVVFDCFYVN